MKKIDFVVKQDREGVLIVSWKEPTHKSFDPKLTQPPLR